MKKANKIFIPVKGILLEKNSNKTCDTEIFIIIENEKVFIFSDCNKKEEKVYQIIDFQFKQDNKILIWNNNNVTYQFQFKEEINMNNEYYNVLNNYNNTHKNDHSKQTPTKNENINKTNLFEFSENIDFDNIEIIFSEKGILYNDKFNELLSKKDFKISKFNNQFYFFIGTKENNLILKCKDVEYKLVERINTINIIQGKNEYFFYFYRKEKSKFDELTKILNIRLYAFNENLKPIIQINIPNFIFDPIHSKVEISKNGKYILLTCDLYLIVIKNEENHSIINLEKENAIILNLSKGDMENFKNERFKDSKFIEDDKVSSSIGKYNIKWDLKEINKYKKSKLKEFNLFNFLD